MILLELFLTFFKIGLFTFGGGYAMLPFIQEEVYARSWMSAENLVDFVAIAESTPGPFAINMATFVGTERAGILGAICSTLGVVLPSFMVILIVAKIYDKFKKSKTVSGCMSGLKPAVIGLIGAALISVGETVFFTHGVTFDVFKSYEFYISLVLFLAMSVLAFKKKHPIIIIIISAAVGIVTGFALNLQV